MSGKPVRRRLLARSAAAVCFLVFACVTAWADAPMPSWPHTISADGATAVVYQPQAISWPNHEVLTARAAVALTPEGSASKRGGAPILGTIELTLATRTDAATELVVLSDPQLKSSHFPSLDTEQAARVDERIRKALPTIRINAVPLNAVLLSLKEHEAPSAAALNNDPPVIFVSDKPASLVVFDGDPVMVPVDKTGLTHAVNTNWNVFSDGETWYLLNNGTWLAAPGSSGPFRPVTGLPPAFFKLPADETFAEARKAIPPHAPQGRDAGPTPVIFVSTRPAEIIVTQGAPQFTPVAGTGLQVVKNTNSVLFFQPSSKEFFLLVSGRWFSADGLNGPWHYASDHLPADFSLIPPDGSFGSVLPSVPGTSQAQLAVLQAQVPKQATLKKDQAKLTVVYAGPPKFAPIPGTPLLYAVNTSYQVIEVSGRYYACYQGAWFEAASPLGPWVLAAGVPQAIYTIPPASPLYPVTYVKVYAATPTTVTYGFTAGYTMGFIAAGTVVYGTGYYYPPVVMPGPVPVYYPYPYSYAGNVAYNPNTRAWTRGGTVYGPYGGAATGGNYYNPNTGAYGQGGRVYGPNGGAGAFSYYNPSTGGYARGSESWGPNGGYAQASYYNPHTGVSGSTSQNWNPYSRWGSSTFAGPNQTVNTQSASNARGSAGSFQSSAGAQGAGYRGVNGNRGGAVQTQNGDVYAGHDGNVYQHNSSGWSKWNDGGWQTVNPPSNGTRSTTNTGAPHSMQTSASPNTAGAARSSGRQSLDPTSFNQLEQDRQARWSGMANRSGGGRFAGEGHFGGGRFRR